jgi:hypothetical protein
MVEEFLAIVFHVIFLSAARLFFDDQLIDLSILFLLRPARVGILELQRSEERHPPR